MLSILELSEKHEEMLVDIMNHHKLVFAQAVIEVLIEKEYRNIKEREEMLEKENLEDKLRGKE